MSWMDDDLLGVKSILIGLILTLYVVVMLLLADVPM